MQDDRVPEYDAQNNSSKASDLAVPELDSILAEEKGREQCMPEECGVEHSAINRKAGSSREKGLSSMFLTSLSGGLEGGPDKKQPHKKRKVQIIRESDGEQAAIHRNRLGQRARRKLWEEKYGSRANHLTKTQAKRRRTRTLGCGSSKEVQSSSEVGRESKPLHPSWTAKKQQQTAIQQFQGQKIVFDSD